MEGRDDGFWAQAIDQYKKTQPQFKKMKSTLKFTDNKTLFMPDGSTPNTGGFMSDGPITGQYNTVYNDLSAKKMVSRKSVFEETFLVTDSIRNIKWKITTETREIAGYTCRRANALVLDSVYVVAFYTDEIPVSGGPESFTGLPGMILGLALPHENVTWFATKVTDTTLPANAIVPPIKGKAVNYKGFIAAISSAMDSWGEYGKKYLRGFSL